MVGRLQLRETEGYIPYLDVSLLLSGHHKHGLDRSHAKVIVVLGRSRSRVSGQ